MAWTPTVLSTTNNTTVKTALQTESVISKTPIGSIPSGLGTTLTAAEYSTGADVVTVLTLNGFQVGTLAGATLGVGAICYSYPASDQHLELVSSFSNVSAKVPGTGTAGVIGLGSVIASGAVSVLSGTATFQNRVTGTAITPSATGGTAINTIVAVTAGIGTGIGLNGTASVKDVFVNMSGAWDSTNIGALTLTGQIFLKWVRMSF